MIPLSVSLYINSIIVVIKEDIIICSEFSVFVILGNSYFPCWTPFRRNPFDTLNFSSYSVILSWPNNFNNVYGNLAYCPGLVSSLVIILPINCSLDIVSPSSLFSDSGSFITLSGSGSGSGSFNTL